MRSLSPQFCVTQLLNDRVDEVGALLFGWMACRRIEGKELVAVQVGGITAERGHCAVCGFRPSCGVFETRASQVSGVCVAGG